MGLKDKLSDVLESGKDKAKEQAKRGRERGNKMVEKRTEGADYRELDNMPPKQRDILNEVVFPNEEFVMSIRLKGVHNPSYLTVTDKRLIKTTPETIGYESKVLDLDKISSIEYDSGLRKGGLTVKGSSIDESYTIKKKYHENIKKFQEEVYSRI